MSSITLFAEGLLSKQQVMEEFGVPKELESKLFAILKPKVGKLYWKEEAKSALAKVLGIGNRPLFANDEFSFGKEESMIAINQAVEPFERIAQGIERLIEVLVPKEAPPIPAIKMLMTPDAAKQMMVNEQTVMKWCREGRLLASKVGGQWLIPQESVNAFIRKCEVIHGRRGGK